MSDKKVVISKLDYEQDMKIEHSELDVEWLEQAELARRYGVLVAELRGQLQLTELKLKELKASLSIEIRDNPEKKLGKPKATIAEVEDHITLDPEVGRLARVIIQKQEELKYAEIMHSEIAFTRKAALENLVTLHGQNYFAGPKTPRSLDEAREARTKRVNASTAKSLNKRRRGDV